MFSISHALVAADAIKLSIDNAIQNGDFVTNHAEEVESRAAKDKVRFFPKCLLTIISYPT